MSNNKHTNDACIPQDGREHRVDEAHANEEISFRQLIRLVGPYRAVEVLDLKREHYGSDNTPHWFRSDLADLVGALAYEHNRRSKGGGR